MRTVAAGVVLLLVAVSGCSSDEAAPAEVGPVASGSPSPSPEVSASPTSMAETSPQSVPSDTTAGPTGSPLSREQAAVALTRKFFDAVNEAYAHRDGAGIRRLSTAQCGSCVAVVEDVDRLAEQNHNVAGRRYIVASAEAAPARPDGQILVDFRFDTDPYIERDAAGMIVQRFPAEHGRDGQVLAHLRDGDWRVAAIRLTDQ